MAFIYCLLFVLVVGAISRYFENKHDELLNKIDDLEERLGGSGNIEPDDLP